MSGEFPEPKGVPKLPGTPAEGPKGLGLGIAFGIAAAGVTAAAGYAADRLTRDRRLALALDETTQDPFHEDPDEVHTVLASDGVALHVEVDHPRAQQSSPEQESPREHGRAGVDAAARPTIVLCHGYCLSLRSWVFQRRMLREAGYRVVLWDHRGHGRSGTGDPDSYDVDLLGDDLARVIEEVAPQGPLVLVGHSMGGMTIMGLALDRPDLVQQRVVGVAFVATSPGNLAGTSYGMGALGKVVHRIAAPTAGLLARRQGFVDGTIKVGRDVVDLLVDWGSFGSPVPMSVAQLTTDMIFGTRMDVISAFMPRFDEMDKREALARFDGIEALVMSGMQDRLTPPEHSEEIVRNLPGAEHIVVADAGHVIMLEHPDLLNEQLVALAERAARAGAVIGRAAGAGGAGGAEGAGGAGGAAGRRRPRTSVRRTVTDLSSARRARQASARRAGRREAGDGRSAETGKDSRKDARKGSRKSSRKDVSG